MYVKRQISHNLKPFRMLSKQVCRCSLKLTHRQELSHKDFSYGFSQNTLSTIDIVIKQVLTLGGTLIAPHHLQDLLSRIGVKTPNQ